MTSLPPDTSVVAVVGPTAVGKTALAEELAVRLGGEVISADSMQIYRGMDVGTAKQPPQVRRVPYHCLDLVAPGEPYSARLFQIAAREAIDDCMSRGVRPVICGGTGLYVRAALDEMDFVEGESVVSADRAHYETLADERGGQALHDLLAERDPASAAVLHPNNTRRVIRALEMADAGVSYAERMAAFSVRRSHYPTDFIGLDMDRGALYRRIDARVDEMVRAGLVDEVRGLLDAGLRDAITAAQAIGYKEIAPVIEAGAGLDEAVEMIKQASRRYAKRQLTWFRADPRVTWLDATDSSTALLADAAMESIIGVSAHLDRR
jgi:tRNA dimethylallyltransferase